MDLEGEGRRAGEAALGRIAAPDSNLKAQAKPGLGRDRHPTSRPGMCPLDSPARPCRPGQATHRLRSRPTPPPACTRWRVPRSRPQAPGPSRWRPVSMGSEWSMGRQRSKLSQTPLSRPRVIVHRETDNGSSATEGCPTITSTLVRSMGSPSRIRPFTSARSPRPSSDPTSRGALLHPRLLPESLSAVP